MDFSDLEGDAKKLADEHPEQADAALDKVDTFVDDRTGDKFGSEIDSGENKLEGALGIDQ